MRRKIQLIGGLVLFTIGIQLILAFFFILDWDTTRPLLLVAVGVGLFINNRRTIAGWVIGGIGIIFFSVNMVIFFFPQTEDWYDLILAITSLIVGIFLVYRYYHDGQQSKV